MTEGEANPREVLPGTTAGGGPDEGALSGTEEYQTEVEPPTSPPPRIDPDIPGSEDPSWFRLAQTLGYESVAACRDRLDDHNWRRVEAQAHAAREARRRPARSERPGLGGYPGRAYRQVNVKLSVADFDAVVALADQRDVPHSTMARMLIRMGINGVLGV